MPTAHARHILVDDESFCQDLIKQLKEGADFAELAKQSKCPSGQQGGDLGTFSKGQMVPEFDKVVFEADLGVYGEPVKTDFGYHVIDVVERDESSAPEVHARHILVKTEEKCQDIIEKLKNGEDFDELAKQSECPSGKSGGDLGRFTKGQMVPEFDKVVFEEPVGVYDKPVKTDFGYHVIEILERS